MRIAFLCSPSPDAWTRRSAEQGLGGSEEAVIHLAAALAARGHRVSVHNSDRAVAERSGNVEYSGYAELACGSVDICVIWRRPGLLSRIAGRGAIGKAYLWLHDLVAQEHVLAHAHLFRKVMVLSRFHRSHYPALSGTQCFVTSNGIDPAEFDYRPQRDPHLLVYGSSYVRGLRTLLEQWSAIRRAVPDARLHVFYGWESLQRINPARAALLRPWFERMLAQAGITHFGRLGHRAVARQYSCAGVWAYPCSFPETSCISAMKAQAGGAVPTIVPTGALRETVRFGFATMRSYTDFAGMALPARIIDEWREGLIGLLRDPDGQQRIRRAMMPASLRRYAWSRVAEAWEREFQAA